MTDPGNPLPGKKTDFVDEVTDEQNRWQPGLAQ